MLKRIIAAALPLAALCVVSLSGQAQAGEPTGTWLRATGTSHIQITSCGGALCGKIVWLKEPNDPDTGKAKTDKMNPDKARRGKPLLGTRVVLNMKATGKAGQWKGEVYKADEGKTYTGFLTMKADNVLKLEGCVMGGLICKSENMTRVE